MGSVAGTGDEGGAGMTTLVAAAGGTVMTRTGASRGHAATCTLDSQMGTLRWRPVQGTGISWMLQMLVGLVSTLGMWAGHT